MVDADEVYQDLGDVLEEMGVQESRAEEMLLDMMDKLILGKYSNERASERD